MRCHDLAQGCAAVGRPFAATSSSRLSNSEQLRAVLGESNRFNFTHVIQEGQQLNGINAAYVSRTKLSHNCV